MEDYREHRVMEDDEHKLFVGCLPVDVTEDDLRSVFSTYGTVVKVFMLDKNAEAQGFKAAFVCYSERNAGEDAIKVLNGIYKIRENADRPIQVKWSQPKGAGEGKIEQEFNDGFKLFVGSLPSDCSEEELQTVFGTYGEVTKVVLMDPNSASGQRCALVFYTAKQSAQDAITVLNAQYKIREDAEAPIVVKWGQDKQKGKDKGGDKGGGKGDKGDKGKGDKGKGDKGKGDKWTAPYDSGTKGKDAKGKDAKSKGKGWDSGSSWQDNSWPAPQNSWQDSSKGKGKTNSWQDSSWQSGQSSGTSWSGGDGGGSSWGQGYDKGGKGSQDKGGKDSKGAKGGKGAPDSGKGGQGASSGGKGGTRLFVANLPGDIGNEAVQYVFQTYGKVQNIHIMTEKPGKGGSVAGFVQYETSDEATTAIASLNDKYEIREGFGFLKVKLANDTTRPAPY